MPILAVVTGGPEHLSSSGDVIAELDRVFGDDRIEKETVLARGMNWKEGRGIVDSPLTALHGLELSCRRPSDDTDSPGVVWYEIGLTHPDATIEERFGYDLAGGLVVSNGEFEPVGPHHYGWALHALGAVAAFHPDTLPYLATRAA